jgi:ribosomal protein L11
VALKKRITLIEFNNYLEYCEKNETIEKETVNSDQTAVSKEKIPVNIDKFYAKEHSFSIKLPPMTSLIGKRKAESKVEVKEESKKQKA